MTRLPDAMPHAVSRLRTACLAHSATLPRLDRGDAPRQRCLGCRLAPSHCMCSLRPTVSARAGVCLVMAEFEPLKPSNTGWLVADLLPATSAFSWSRTQVDPGLPAALADPLRQPYIVFPGEFAEPRRRVVQGLVSDKPPLFVLLDGTWAQARKIFRKSPCLDPYPVLDLQPAQVSRYRLRRSAHGHHLCTAEVAALCLELAGDDHAARTLAAYLDVFGNRYLSARQSVAPDPTDDAHRRLRLLSDADRDGLDGAPPDADVGVHRGP